MNGLRALQPAMRLAPTDACDSVSGPGEDLNAEGRVASVAADRMRKEITQ